jgi:hypothetical protein
MRAGPPVQLLLYPKAACQLLSNLIMLGWDL